LEDGEIRTKNDKLRTFKMLTNIALFGTVHINSCNTCDVVTSSKDFFSLIYSVRYVYYVKFAVDNFEISRIQFHLIYSFKLLEY